MSACPPTLPRGSEGTVQRELTFGSGSRDHVSLLGSVEEHEWAHLWGLKSRPRKFSVAGMSSPPMAEETSSCQYVLLDLREGCTSRK